ncbi:hypothetical protein BGZ61DRAFT_572799 [Ilyonectria robusta]|uniref:uncharacterized protein n=1 Tax=Ilyonectria robusta TaxID=1079257 RepID=UPI001E8ECD17|nr:uncharacterized protein BGZ61DRAFT_572799 [Ilyonectria robusta]KAH8654679.1 hypothetical protein BGZ61DRAFT_572799 [Ilyonectria robusta]
MPTLLEVLTRRNVAVNSQSVVPGSNTTTETHLEPDGWSPWPDFNYDTLTRIFWRQLASEYQGSPEQRPLELDLFINNEETLEDVLRRFLSSIVNYALDGQEGQPHLGRGSRCGSEDKPDWSAVSGQCIDEYGRYANILPGDTKLDAKWWPTMSEEAEDFNEWQKVVAQVQTYMARHQTRYGFIITDANLVALRLTREPISTGLAQERPRREAAALAGHQRHSSDVTMASGDGSSSLYSDNNPLEWSYYNPEYAVIAWDAHGNGRLTIKLALWCLAMMAANGDRWIDYSYPQLDSWRSADKGYAHSTSGTTKARLSRGDVYLEPDPDRARREEATREAAHESSQVPRDEHYDSAQSQDVDDAPQFSQAGSTFGDVPGQVGSSRRRHRRKHVKIHRHKKGRGLYFVNAHGSKIDTTKKEWKNVEDGYEFEGRKNVYYTREFPH